MRSFGLYREGGFKMTMSDGADVTWTPRQWEEMLAARKHCEDILAETSAHNDLGVEYVPNIPDPRELEVE